MTGHALAVDVSSVLRETGAALDVDADVPLGSITAGDAVIEFVEAPRLTVTVTNVGDVLTVRGFVEATATVECARCLEPFPLHIRGAVEAAVALTGEADSSLEDHEWYSLNGETLDLLPAAESAIRMEMPFAPVHAESCRGICPTCGCDLNRDECGCEPTHPGAHDTPFAALRELLPPVERED
ncbi:MAG TPA: DUF177 domain-containing protein [Coriobacteriia bacterium]|nr:DUF177 domain-containing protein [Coriobacteriia bacterium]